MDAIFEILNRAIEQLIGRASGPLHFRLLIMPTVVTILAIRAGLKDARKEQPAFLWAYIFHAKDRKRLFRSAFKDVGRIFIVAVVLDTIYQIIALRAFYIVQVLIVAVACAIVPYVLVRGLVNRIASHYYRKHSSSYI
jgi:hypothetical protein